MVGLELPRTITCSRLSPPPKLYRQSPLVADPLAVAMPAPEATVSTNDVVARFLLDSGVSELAPSSSPCQLALSPPSDLPDPRQDVSGSGCSTQADADEDLPCLLATMQYLSTLDSFLAETDTPAPSAEPVSSAAPSLRDLVEEYNSERLSASLRSLVVEQDDVAQDVLKQDFPEEQLPRAAVKTLGDIHAGNVLTVRTHRVPRRTFNTSTAE